MRPDGAELLARVVGTHLGEGARVLLLGGDDALAAALAPRVAALERRALEELEGERGAGHDAAVAPELFARLAEREPRERALGALAAALAPAGLLAATFTPRLAALRAALARFAAEPGSFEKGALVRAFMRASFPGSAAWLPWCDELGAAFARHGFAPLELRSLAGLAQGAEEALAELAARAPRRLPEALEILETTAGLPAVVELGGPALWVGRRGAAAG